MNVEVSLHTGPPGKDRKNEAKYPGYKRVVVPGNTFWFGGTFVTAPVTFPPCTGGAEVITDFAVESPLFSLREAITHCLHICHGITPILNLKISFESVEEARWISTSMSLSPPVDLSRWPGKCPRCGGPAYQGLGAIECMKKCS